MEHVFEETPISRQKQICAVSRQLRVPRFESELHMFVSPTVKELRLSVESMAAFEKLPRHLSKEFVY